jgi:hypothetical protein
MADLQVLNVGVPDGVAVRLSGEREAEFESQASLLTPHASLLTPSFSRFAECVDHFHPHGS